MMLSRSSPELGVAWVADQLLGEPPTRWHPVAHLGAWLHWFESVTYRDSRRAGVFHTAIAVGGSVLVGGAVERVLGRRVATCAATVVCVAGRMLGDEVRAVGNYLAVGDLVGARHQVGRLVGRDTTQLDETGVARAAIETMAENTVDGVTASLWWGWVAGAPGVLAHRTVNTLDAMIGHRNARYERFGWAAARLDDVAGWVPARLTAVVVAAVCPRRAAAMWRAVRRDAPQHPSPNGGVIEAAVAAALGVQLGGVNRYGDRVEARGTLGDGAAPRAGDVERAVNMMTAVSGVTALAVSLAYRTVRRIPKLNAF